MRRILFLDDLKIRLRHTVVVQENPADGLLSSLRQVVGIDVENLAAGVVAEDQQICQLRNPCVAVD